MIEATIEKLITMKLFGMAEGLKEQLNNHAYNDLSFEERLGILVDKEKLSRENRQLKILLAHAHLRHPDACFENIDFRTRRGLAKDVILNLSQNEWIHRHQNLIIVGPTGAGKTFIACSLGNAAVRQGIRTIYMRMPRLAQELKISRADGSLVKLLARLQRIQLLIIDDWGINPFTDDERRNFLEIMEDRYGVRSTIIASQFPIDAWHDIIGDPTFADAICDRIVHNAHKIILKGGEDSMRKIYSGLT
ncbi:MAG TPA: IS21-like element helper ATPase IstB [Syntrophorhabdaceae bacterium]|nr:IS21-like element helper ATPase IstB [Syntrophorhabdaceae bacterium]HQI57459.1 IS21-like element helper ATPase IstB [Syntrophorhabdaceae bacterium]HQJ95456.1 IS21-like element helper ATPase IstB [Syntrophorhabdaceae bacterium]